MEAPEHLNRGGREVQCAVCLWLVSGWPLVGLWLASSWPLVGPEAGSGLVCLLVSGRVEQSLDLVPPLPLPISSLRPAELSPHFRLQSVRNRLYHTFAHLRSNEVPGLPGRHTM